MELPQDSAVNHLFPVVDAESPKLFKVCDVDTSTLIKLVHERNELWDRRLSKHQNRPFAQQAWDDISRCMGIPAYVVRKKWKNLRDCYGVELSKPFESRWIHFEALSFLRGFVKPREKMKPVPPPEDPLALDPLDDNSLAEDPTPTLTGDNAVDVKEEKFDLSEFRVVAVGPISPSEQTPSVRVVPNVEPPAKKARTDEILLFNSEVQKPQLNDATDPLNTETDKPDVAQSILTVACQTNEADIANRSNVSYFDQNLNSDDASNSSLEMINNLNPNRRAQIATLNKNKVFAHTGENPIFPDSLKMKNSCSACSNQVDGYPVVSNCCENTFSPELLEPSNKVDPRARSNSNSSIDRNLKASNSTTVPKELPKEYTQNYKKFDDGNVANMAAIDLTEDDASDDTTEDENFFRSILPHVRKIPHHLKLRFRNRLHELVEEFAYPHVETGKT